MDSALDVFAFQLMVSTEKRDEITKKDMRKAQYQPLAITRRFDRFLW
jgi:hypothetical protein